MRTNRQTDGPTKSGARRWSWPALTPLLLIGGCLGLSVFAAAPGWFPGYTRAMARGMRPVAEAVGAFKAKYGFYPQAIEELVPEFLASVPGYPSYQNFRPWGGGAPRLLGAGMGYKAHLVYTFPIRDEPGNWAASREYDQLDLDFDPVPIPDLGLTEEERNRNSLGLLDRWIASPPAGSRFPLDNWRMKVYFLLELKRYEDTRAECGRLLMRHPEDWWANLIIAWTYAESGDLPAARSFLDGWVASSTNFRQLWLVSRFYAHWNLADDARRQSSVARPTRRRLLGRREGGVRELPGSGRLAGGWALARKAATRRRTVAQPWDGYRPDLPPPRDQGGSDPRGDLP